MLAVADLLMDGVGESGMYAVEPAGQAEHAPLQADVDRPVVLPYVPAGQLIQLVELNTSLYVPSGQLVHD